MIKLEHVSKAYSAGIPALNDVNLEIDDGEFVFVCGDSGSGKSTLIKLLLKELDPTDGTITVDGRNLARIRHKQVPKYRRNVGVVFQDFRLLKDRNVYENVAFALKVIGASTAVIKKKVPQMLSMVGLAAKYKSKPRELSGGEQQRVAIARALVNEPSMLLADEPTMDFLLSGGESVESKYLIVNLALPKFDTASDLDLADSLKALGITDVFDPAVSDFSPMTDDTAAYLSQAKHAARVTVDEEGVTAAAYTVMMTCGAAAPPEEEVDFVLNRPFVFAITGTDGLPLFVGIVHQPQP